MKIFVPRVVEGQEWILPRQTDSHDILNGLSGARRPRWQPLQMELFREPIDGTVSLYSDFPWLSAHVLVVKSRALESLRPSLEGYGEFLPLRAEENVWLFNVTRVINALDEERSEIVRFDDGSILDIARHAFRAEVIGGAEIFELPEDVVRLSSIYLQEPMVHRIEELGLTGIGFEMVWTDEPSSADQISIEYTKPEPDPDRGFLRSIWDRLGRRGKGS